MAGSPPVEPTVEAPPARRRRWLPVTVFALHAAALAWIALVLHIDDGNNRDAGLLFGLLFAQVTLAAVWIAWAPASWFWRIAGGFVLISAGWLALAGCILRTEPDAAGVSLVYGVCFLGQWLAVQAPLWAARIVYGQRVVGPQELIEQQHPNRERQFGLGQLLLLTACVAALLGAARWLFPSEAAHATADDWREWLLIAGLFIAFNTLAPLPTIWAALARRRLAPWLLLAALYMAGVSVAETLAFAAVVGPPREHLYNFFLWTNLAFFLIVAATLLAFRSAGYRLRTG